MGLWKCVALAAGLTAAVQASTAPQADSEYRSVVDAFATAPNEAIERMLAMPPDIVERSVHDAARKDSGWSADALDRALLMHGDAAIALTRDHARDAGRQVMLADELAIAAAANPANAWFVHRWYRVFTARVAAKPLEAHWKQQGWYHAAAAVDRGRELETAGGKALFRADLETIETPALLQAIPLYEQGIAAGLPAASLRLGRVQMLRGKDTEARRLFGAAEDDTSRVTRYLAHLFLGAMSEREQDRAGAEGHYRKAVAALPGAQSGRLALAAFLARAGRVAEARTAAAVGAAAAVYDPWRSYFFIPGEEPSLFAELHAEVCR